MESEIAAYLALCGVMTKLCGSGRSEDLALNFVERFALMTKQAIDPLALSSKLVQPSPFTKVMQVLILLSLLFFVPFLFFLAFLALSSCLGDRFRARVSGITFNPRYASFGRSYGRTVGSGIGGWEQIEMQDILRVDENDED